LIVLSGFGSQELHLKLATIMFQNIFPAIDINTVKLSTCQRLVLLNYNKDTKLIDFRHYSIRLQPVGVSRRIRKFVQNHQVPDLRNLQDVSDFVTKAGYGSESEGDEEAATVTLSSDLGRVNKGATKSAVKLQEIGPRMTMQLVKVEEGLCTGGIIFSEYGKC
jgi:ribosome biogenesis protein SSF1/2